MHAGSGNNWKVGSGSEKKSFWIQNTANGSQYVFSLTKIVFFVEEVWDRSGGGDAGVPVRRAVLACQAQAGSGLDKILQDIPAQVINTKKYLLWIWPAFPITLSSQMWTVFLVARGQYFKYVKFSIGWSGRGCGRGIIYIKAHLAFFWQLRKCN
jgi:hypothetical protein